MTSCMSMMNVVKNLSSLVFLILVLLCSSCARPPPSERKFVSTAIDATIVGIKSRMKDPILAAMFENCLPNTLDTTVQSFTLDSSGQPDSFIITGDISAMWLRDSTNQISPYVPFVPQDARLDALVRGVIRRQARSILMDPYANAFQFNSSTPSPWSSDLRFPNMTNGLWEGKFELDSLMNFLRLSHLYYSTVVNSSVDILHSPFDQTWLLAVNKTVEVVVNMSRSFDEEYIQPSYKFQRKTYVPSDTLLQFGLGPPSKACGLVRSPFRASDDATNLPMNIPENALAVVALRGVAEMCSYGSKLVISCDELGDTASTLAAAIDAAILSYGVSTNARFPGVLAYEVDCFGNQLFFDDANSPSLLSLPYIGYMHENDALYRTTRHFILSDGNPFFFRGSTGEGVGSPHVPWRFVWPMSIVMRALTSSSDDEIAQCLTTLRDTTAGTNFMHESFNVNNASDFTRPWFAWANTLFGDLVLKLFRERPWLILDEDAS